MLLPPGYLDLAFFWQSHLLMSSAGSLPLFPQKSMLLHCGSLWDLFVANARLSSSPATMQQCFSHARYGTVVPCQSWCTCSSAGSNETCESACRYHSLGISTENKLSTDTKRQQRVAERKFQRMRLATEMRGNVNRNLPRNVPY